MSESFSRSLINQAVFLLQHNGEAQCAQEVMRLLAHIEQRPQSAVYKCWLDDDNLDGLVRCTYPPSPDWDEATVARHYRMMKHAIQAFPEVLNEDVKLLLKKFEEAQKVKGDRKSVV